MHAGYKASVRAKQEIGEQCDSKNPMCCGRYELNWGFYLEGLREMPILEEYPVCDLEKCENVLSPFAEILSEAIEPMYDAYFQSRVIERICQIFLQTNTPEVTQLCLSIIANYAYIFPRDIPVFCDHAFFEKLRGLVDVASPQTREYARSALLNLGYDHRFFEMREFHVWMEILDDFDGDHTNQLWLAQIIARHSPTNPDDIARLIEMFCVVFQKPLKGTEDNSISAKHNAILGLKSLLETMNQDMLEYYACTYIDKVVVDGLGSELLSEPASVFAVFRRLLSLSSFRSDWILSEFNWQTITMGLKGPDEDLQDLIFDFLSYVADDFDITSDELISTILFIAENGVYRTKSKATKLLCLLLTRSPNIQESLATAAYPMIINTIFAKDPVNLPEIVPAIRDLMAKSEEFVDFICQDPDAVECLYEITCDNDLAQEEGLKDAMRSIDIIMREYTQRHTQE